MSENPLFYNRETRFFGQWSPTNSFEVIRATIEEQISLERGLSFDKSGIVHVNERLNFIIDSGAAELAAAQMFVIEKQIFSGTDLDVVDVGGGTGKFIQTYSQLAHSEGIKVHGTITNLVDLFKLTGRPIPENVRHIVTSAEFPPDELFKAFDLVVSINGPLQWSHYPVIVLENLLKMLKNKGMLFVFDEPNYHNGFKPSTLLEQDSSLYTIPWYINISNELFPTIVCLKG